MATSSSRSFSALPLFSGVPGQQVAEGGGVAGTTQLSLRSHLTRRCLRARLRWVFRHPKPGGPRRAPARPQSLALRARAASHRACDVHESLGGAAAAAGKDPARRAGPQRVAVLSPLVSMA